LKERGRVQVLKGLRPFKLPLINNLLIRAFQAKQDFSSKGGESEVEM